MDRDCLPAFIGDISMTIVDAMAKIDSNSRGIVFIVDERDSLCGCITDGDIRRWILKAGDIHETVCCAMTHSPKYLFCEERAKAYGVMVKNFITALPILDGSITTGILLILFCSGKVAIILSQKKRRISQMFLWSSWQEEKGHVYILIRRFCRNH